MSMPDSYSREDWDWLFDRTIEIIYQREIERTGNKSAASKTAERVQSAMIMARAETAERRKNARVLE